MNTRQIRLCEDALYCIKYLPGQIEKLRMELDNMMPPSSGSILKMTGRPVAKTPCDTSETETWGLKRAMSREGQELSAKTEINNVLRQWVTELPAEEQRFIKYVYGKEWPRHTVVREMGISLRQYYRLRERVLEQAWKRIRQYESMLDMAVV